jgi:hypothetical protein
MNNWAAIVIAVGHDQKINQTQAGLIKIAGLSVIKRNIKTARHQKATSCVLVVGPDSDAIIEEAQTSWDDQNTFTVINMTNSIPENEIIKRVKQESRVSSDYFGVIYADTAFSANILQALLLEDNNNTNSVVAVDRHTQYAGLALLTAEFIESLPAEGALSDFSRTNSNKKLIFRPLENSFTHRLQKPKDITRAEAKQVQSLRRNSDGIVSRWLNRPLSLFFSRYVFSKLPFTPNHITFIAGLIGWCGIALVFFWPGYWWVLLGAGLFHVSSVLDGCDGEIARLRFQFSKFGEWFDNVLDEVSNAAFIAAIGIGTWRSGGEEYLLWISLAYCLVVTLVDAASFYQMVKWRGGSGNIDNVRWFFDKYESDSKRENPTAFPPKRTFGDLLMQIPRRDFYIFALLILAAFDILIVGFWISIGTGIALFSLGICQWIWILNGGLQRAEDRIKLSE